MQESGKVLIVAGSDPSAGAGLQADLKTMEAHGVYACTVVTTITWQHESGFEGLEWVKPEIVLNQLRTLLRKYSFPVVKFGIIEDMDFLGIVCKEIRRHNPDAKLVWDPVLKASSGFQFHGANVLDSANLLSQMEVITPNWTELVGNSDEDKVELAKKFSAFTNVLVKGGHRKTDYAIDYLFQKRNVEVIKFSPETIAPYGKHGSGCVMASAIAANLMKGHSLVDSITNAKKYITAFLLSTDGMLGKHGY